MSGEGLEPAAWGVDVVDPAWSDNVVRTEIVKEFTYVCAHERGDKEPLVRVSDVHDLIQDKLDERGFEDYFGDNADARIFFEDDAG